MALMHTTQGATQDHTLAAKDSKQVAYHYELLPEGKVNISLTQSPTTNPTQHLHTPTGVGVLSFLEADEHSKSPNSHR